MPKNWNFTKGDRPWFWSKFGNFPFFYFTRNKEEIFVLRYSRMKRKRRSRL